MSKLNNALQRQIALNKTKNMLYTHLDQAIEIDPDFLAILEELCAKDEEVLPELELHDAISFAASTLLQRLYSINQFLQVDEKKVRNLERIYLRTWKRILETKDIRSSLKNYHYPALTRWIAGLYPANFVEQLRSVPSIGHVVCGEYSPELQIELLQIDLQAVKQPLLDIGCGSSAGLVRYLRMFQIDAYGFDRHIDKEETYLQQGNWLTYDFKSFVWGTIISNMAFTNHFLHVYHHDKKKIRQYEQKYHEIIESLAVGGSFHYAPSIPFIELGLEEEKYQVEQLAVIKDIGMTRITKVKP